MEDRKRPAIAVIDDMGPPSKRQAVNGATRSREDTADMKEEAWLEEYQKGAIYRQMLEYKREKSTLEQRLDTVEKKAADHDDHIRYVDAWWLQLLQEVEILADGSLTSNQISSESLNGTGLQFRDSRDFQKHLGEKAKIITSRLENLLSRISSSRGEVKADVAELEKQVKMLLAKQKELMVKLERISLEKDDLSEQLDRATLRYVKAEKKLDRTKSAQVQKLEQQAIANATSRPANSEGENGAESSETNSTSEALQAEILEVTAVAAKHKEQLESLFAELKAIQDENSTFKSRREGTTEDDFARSEVFRQLKAQNEDLIRRINHLEAVDKQLREEVEKFQAERTLFRTQLEGEAQRATGELEDQIQVKEQDLTRIRSARDELVADISMRKASQEQQRQDREHLNDLIERQTEQIATLDSQLNHLKPPEELTPQSLPAELEAISLEELRTKYLKLQKDYDAINNELPVIEKAYRKSMVLGKKKIMDFAALEERVAILIAEKAKADQKYFAAHKDMDMRKAEIRALRTQNSKSSEIIAQLKEVESQNRTLLSNLEKQLSDLKQSNMAVVTENKRLEALSTDAQRRLESGKSQVTDLTNLVKSKDATNIALRERATALEAEAEKLKVRADNVQKDRDNWKAKSLSNTSVDEDMLRKLVMCSVCRNNFKNSILKTCGHMFCTECLQDRIANRMRKCPTCSKSFDKADIMLAHL